MPMQYFIVAIDSDSKPGDLGTMLCREMYLQCGGDRARVWQVIPSISVPEGNDSLSREVHAYCSLVRPLQYDPIIDDGHPPPGYVPDTHIPTYDANRLS